MRRLLVSIALVGRRVVVRGNSWSAAAAAVDSSRRGDPELLRRKDQWRRQPARAW